MSTLQVQNIIGQPTANLGVTFALSANVGGAITSSGSISDIVGNVRDVVQNAKTSAYVLVAADNGKHISITTGGVTVPSSIFSIGQSVTIYNDSLTNQIITQGSGTAVYLVGTNTTGNRTLAQNGLATILCVGPNKFIITGGGLT